MAMMRVIRSLINEDLLNAAAEFEKATSENIVELCRSYLLVLAKYSEELHDLGGIPEIRFAAESKAGRELVEQARRAIRSAIETAVNERNRVESLLKSFTLINAYDAADTFNRLKFRDLSGWEANGRDVHSAPDGERLSIQDAVEAAGLLRRTAYVAYNTTFYR